MRALMNLVDLDCCCRVRELLLSPPRLLLLPPFPRLLCPLPLLLFRVLLEWLVPPFTLLLLLLFPPVLPPFIPVTFSRILLIFPLCTDVSLTPKFVSFNVDSLVVLVDVSLPLLLLSFLMAQVLPVLLLLLLLLLALVLPFLFSLLLLLLLNV